MSDCILCDELQKTYRIIYETNNFIITPALGQIGIQGYVLICSKKHYAGLCELPNNLIPELDDLMAHTRSVLQNIYKKSVVLFEHGPRSGNCKGGACIEHFHFHCIPTDTDLYLSLGKHFIGQPITDLTYIAQHWNNNSSSYIFIEDQESCRFLFEIRFPLPSQYLRQIIACHLQRSDWDWRIYPDIETFERSLVELNGKFS
jgi:diadenosine tetraphosphate (Ap4A) HIT family hydrolase